MRLWDEDPGGAKGRLTELQGLLDELWKSSPAGQPAFVRDARWLIPLALSLITDELAPYFEVVQQFADTLPEADRLEIDRAHVRMLGGHLTSQIRYYCTKDGIAIDDASVVLRTRTSNALDLALLVQGLVGLLRAYEAAPDEQRRLEMAGAIFQGISPDPELFVHRLDLLRAYTMIEQVLVADGEYTPHGARHVRLVEEYKARMERLLPKLREDVAPFRPMAGGCSPYGVLAGLPSNLIEHMALKAVQRDAETRFSLEDVFDDGGPGAAKLAWVNGWRRLPHVPREVQRAFEYPQGFAEEIFARIEREIGRSGGFKTGRLLLTDAPEIPELEARYFADSGNPQQLLRDRQEGHYLVSYQTPGGWVAVKKELLTEVLGAGRDTRIGGLPQDAAQVLRRMCGELASG
jgi:hypothetical protein